jgi:PAS domain S-box-containing protein
MHDEPMSNTPPHPPIELSTDDLTQIIGIAGLSVFVVDATSRTIHLSHPPVPLGQEVGMATYQPTEVPMERWYRELHAEDLPPCRKTIEQALAGQLDRWDFEYRQQDPGGQWHWLRCRGVAQRRDDGAVWRLIGNVRDVSHRRKISEELAQTRQQARALDKTLRAALDHVDISVAIFDANERLILCNAAYRRDFVPAYPGHTLEGMTIEEIVTDVVERAEPGTASMPRELSVWAERRLADFRRADGEPRLIHTDAGEWLQRADYRTEDGGTITISSDVTHLRRAESQARLLAAVAQVTSNGMAISDIKGRVTWVNPSLERMSGFSAQGLLGKRLHQLLVGADGSTESLQWIVERIQAAEPAQAELLLHRADGTPFWVRYEVQLIPGANDEPKRLVHVLTDVTERRRFTNALAKAQQAAVNAQQSLEDAMSTAEIALAIYDSREQLVLCNSRYAAGLGEGVTPAQLRNRSFEHVLKLALQHPSGRGADVESQGEDRFVEARLSQFRRADGQPVLQQMQDGRWIQRAEFRMRNQGTVSVRQDVTLLKAAELRAQQLAVVATHTKNSIVITDAAGRTRWVNPAFTQQTGFTLQDMEGRTPGSVLQGEGSDPQVIAQMRAGLQAGSGFSVEILNYTSQGTPFWAAIDALPIRDDSGRITQYVSVQADVTEQRAASAALMKAKEDAEAASQARSRFVANMSHELRTPTSGIVGLLDFVLRDPVTEDQARFLGLARRSATALLAVINDILDLSKLESGKLTLAREPFDIAGVTYETCRTLAAQAGAKQLRFSVWVDDLPARVIGDAQRYRQVLTNLLSNAFKFTDEGEVVVSVEPIAGVDGQYLLSVRDTGIGIPADKLQRIFSPFEQADDTVSRRYGGTGLGLAICDLICSAMGGKIEVESSPLAGSTFRVRLPLEAASSPAPNPRRNRLRGEALVLSLQSDGWVRPVQRKLEQIGLQVRACSSTTEALALVEQPGRSLSMVVVDSPRGGAAPGLGGVLRALNSALPATCIRVALVDADEFGHEVLRQAREHQWTTLIRPLDPADLVELTLKRPTEGVASGTPAAGLGTRPALALANHGRAVSVLVAEDNAINALIIEQQLRQLGAIPTLVDSGTEAVRMRQEQAFDLAFMDMHMPEMGGVEATQRIRAWELQSAREPLPIYALTANILLEDRDRCLAAGMNGFMTKPVQLDDLKAVLDGQMHTHRLRAPA